MRTTVDLPEGLLAELVELTGSNTQREALILAIEETLRRRRLQRVLDAAGTLDLDLDVRDLRQRSTKRLES